eukprot:Amastigsp_a179828_143.p4 type:complete len:131 gc:universal Amastigsp_a179828_143:922-1314(+)
MPGARRRSAIETAAPPTRSWTPRSTLLEFALSTSKTPTFRRCPSMSNLRTRVKKPFANSGLSWFCTCSVMPSSRSCFLRARRYRVSVKIASGSVFDVESVFKSPLHDKWISTSADSRTWSNSLEESATSR